MLNLARALLALLTLCAIGQQLALHLNASFSALNFFSYFTNLANLFAASVLFIAVFSGGRGRADRLRYASAVNMTIVGLVFVVLLRDTDLGALLPWVNVVLHYVMPMAIVVDWLLGPPTRRLSARDAALNLVFPALYLTYVLIRGAHIGWYPYPFLNPATAGGFGHVALYALGIAVTFLLASAALLQAGNHLARSRRLDAD